MLEQLHGIKYYLHWLGALVAELPSNHFQSLSSLLLGPPIHLSTAPLQEHVETIVG